MDLMILHNLAIWVYHIPVRDCSIHVSCRQSHPSSYLVQCPFAFVWVLCCQACVDFAKINSVISRCISSKHFFLKDFFWNYGFAILMMRWVSICLVTERAKATLCAGWEKKWASNREKEKDWGKEREKERGREWGREIERLREGGRKRMRKRQWTERKEGKNQPSHGDSQRGRNGRWEEEEVVEARQADA